MTTTSDPHAAGFDAIAQRTRFSIDAVESMWRSIVAGGGSMAQFDHADFGGPGQWMRGGMLMISDFSNSALKGRIAALCDALATTFADEPAPPARDDWYPASLGKPDSSGAQNDVRYAWFGDARRLAIDDGTSVTVYDTGTHRIGGVSQQQGASRTVSFVSQHGAVDVDRLPVVDGASQTPIDPDAAATPAAGSDVPDDPFVALEKLDGLHRRGIVDDDEFAAKKADLLRKI